MWLAVYLNPWMVGAGRCLKWEGGEREEIKENVVPQNQRGKTPFHRHGVGLKSVEASEGKYFSIVRTRFFNLKPSHARMRRGGRAFC